MGEEIKKNDQDAELDKEALDKVSGGVIIHRKTVTCPECGTTYPEDWGECPTCNPNGGGTIVAYHCDSCGRDFSTFYELGRCPYCRAEVKL